MEWQTIQIAAIALGSLLCGYLMGLTRASKDYTEKLQEHGKKLDELRAAYEELTQDSRP